MKVEMLEVAEGRRVAVHVDEGHAPLVLLAHGVGSSALFLEEAFGAPLRAAGWRLAAMDLRGHGDSDTAPSPLEHGIVVHAGDLVTVAAALGPQVIGGVSIGAMAALTAAATVRPRAVLGVIPGWLGSAEAGSGPHAAVAEEVRRAGVAGMLARLASEPDLPAWIREVVLRDYRRHDEASLAAALMSLDGAWGPGLDAVELLDAPMAVVGWPDDPGHPLEVARAWAGAGRPGHLEVTSIDAMQDDRTAFGRAGVAALAAVGVLPG